ncbi:hypothetical protein BCR39DRAFT_590111 [Naematelia encephala]|uniref:Fe2OG dioxygenase domain-containing protein n=1 Tax=Naematelia encephala TaxID=71784 RepID=A0A1Y2ASS6_9TREE|nr:hypothetical protein BCR39DRAFT_590111 [Naematelia encephala]
MPHATYALPIIDVEDFKDGLGENDRTIASSLVAAFHDRGFAYITGHGVTQDKIDGVFEQARRFMSLPTQAKMALLAGTDGVDTKGYSYPGMAKVTQNAEMDGADLDKLVHGAPGMNETFRVGIVNGKSDPERMPKEEDLPGFAEAFITWSDECVQVYHRLLRIIALGLGSDVTYFDRFHLAGTVRTPTIQHYLGGVAQAGHGRLNEHTDYGYLTLLFQDSVGGLEVVDAAKNNEFVRAPPVDKAITVNVGDMLSRWTNGILKSTMHRVSAPPDAVKDGVLPERYSIPCFCGPSPNTIVDTMPGTYGPNRPKLYPPVNGTEHIQMRQAKMYPKKKAQ